MLGLDPARQGNEIRAAVGVLLESDGLYARLSAVDNLEFRARVRHLGSAAQSARIEELLRSFGLWERRRDAVVGWSKGMRQKLAIARALLHRPRLILLRRAVQRLDPAAAAELREEIMGLARDEGVTVLLTTHNLSHVEKACSEVALIKGGKVIASRSPDRLIAGGGDLEVEVRGAGLSLEVLGAMKERRLVRSFRMDEAGGACELHSYRCGRGWGWSWCGAGSRWKSCTRCARRWRTLSWRW